MKKYLFVCTLTGLVSLSTCADQLLDAMALRYDFTEWRGKVMTNYPQIVLDWALPTLQLQTNGCDSISVTQNCSSNRCRLWIGEGDCLLLRVDSRIHTSPEMAHHDMLARFASMSTPKKYTRVRNIAGDVLFHLVQDNASDSVVFARNNVSISVFSGMTGLSATNIAQQLDSSILRASGKAP